jgi:peptide/nickel transport system permease protein
MTSFIVRRLLLSAFLLLTSSLIAFSAVYLIGNPIDLLIGPQSTEAEKVTTMRELGLDRPIVEQYGIFLSKAIQFDFGKSFQTASPVKDLFTTRLPATLEVAGLAFLISLVGLPLGVLAGLKPQSLVAKSIMTGSIFGISLPPFWIGLMLILVFSVNLGWLPSSGRGETVTLLGTEWAFTASGLAHLALPSLTLSLLNAALLIRLTRAGMQEVLLMDYVKYARAKGISNRRVVWVHALRNTLIPIITLQGLEIASMLASSIVVEQIFAYPGIGRLALDAITHLDRPVLVAFMMFIVSAFIVINLVVDILYATADPRIRLN